MAESLLTALEHAVGAAHVYTRHADLAAYSYDAFGASGDRHLPDAVVFPASTAEVSAVVRACHEHGTPVVPRGAGTGYAAGAVAHHGGVVVCLTRMSRVLGVEVEHLRIHAEAGAITADIHTTAEAAGLYFPPDPGASTTSTIGGNVACNAAGPHALRYGATADYLVGATAVLADGTIVRVGEGGTEDSELLSLLPQSEGTLAVITEVLLRLLPAPAARATLRASFREMHHGVNAVAEIAAAGIVPAALEFLDANAIRAVAEAGIEVPAAGALILVEVEGDAATVEREAMTARTALERAGAFAVDHAADPVEAYRLWQARKAVSAAVAAVVIGKVNEDVVVPRDRVAELLALTDEIGNRHQVPVVCFGHLGDGNIHVSFLIDPRVAGERARGDAAAADLFEAVLAMGGSITGEHGVGTSKLAFAERQLGRPTLELMHRIKSRLDPTGILNPGVKLPPLSPVEEAGDAPAATAESEPAPAH